MMRKFKVWQVGWEHEAKENYFDDDDDGCVACEAAGRIPHGSIVVLAFAPVDDPTKIQHKRMEGLGGIMTLCANANEEDIAEAKADAEDIRSGKLEEIKP